jgi:hypothetical protein
MKWLLSCQKLSNKTNTQQKVWQTTLEKLIVLHLKHTKLVGFLNDNNIVHHTYQLEEERAYRVVIIYLHHSVNTKEIENQLTQMGHKVRNVIIGRHRVTKQPLNLFFVDLEPAGNDKEIYTINWLQNKAVAIEPPRRSKIYRNAINVRSMDIPRHTAIDLLFASSVVVPMPPQVVKNQTTLLPHALYAMVPICRIIKDVSFITTF